MLWIVMDLVYLDESEFCSAAHFERGWNNTNRFCMNKLLEQHNPRIIAHSIVL